MTLEGILRFVRSKPRAYAKTPGECQMMGHRLSEFPPAEQAEILLWALENEQQRSAGYAKTIEMLQKKAP